jgi:hypothetical protein
MRFTKLSLIGLLAVLGSSAHAQVVYGGADLNAGPGDAHPNSATAAAAFDTAAGALGTLNVITFEDAALGSFTSLAAAPGVTLTGASYLGNPHYVNNVPNFPVAPRLDGFNMTPGGANYVEIIGGTATFTFADPIQAFGLYVTGVQVAFFQDTISFDNGSAQTINVPTQFPSNSSNGSLSFVGFTDIGKSITKVVITASNNFGADAIGIDDVRFVLSPRATDVPEPGSLAMLAGVGVSAAGLVIRRRIARK